MCKEDCDDEAACIFGGGKKKRSGRNPWCVRWEEVVVGLATRQSRQSRHRRRGGTLFITTRDDDDIKKTLIKKDDFTLTFSIFPPKNGVKKVLKKILLFALEQKTRLSLKIGLEKERTSNHHHALRV